MATSVSIRDLKDHLSNYVRRIQAGEEILLTSRRQPVARMLPVQKPGGGPLADLPMIRWAGEKPLGGSLRPRIEGAVASGIVLEERR